MGCVGFGQGVSTEALMTDSSPEINNRSSLLGCLRLSSNFGDSGKPCDLKWLPCIHLLQTTFLGKVLRRIILGQVNPLLSLKLIYITHRPSVPVQEAALFPFALFLHTKALGNTHQGNPRPPLKLKGKGRGVQLPGMKRAFPFFSLMNGADKWKAQRQLQWRKFSSWLFCFSFKFQIPVFDGWPSTEVLSQFLSTFCIVPHPCSLECW